MNKYKRILLDLIDAQIGFVTGMEIDIVGPEIVISLPSKILYKLELNEEGVPLMTDKNAVSGVVLSVEISDDTFKNLAQGIVTNVIKPAIS